MQGFLSEWAETVMLVGRGSNAQKSYFSRVFFLSSKNSRYLLGNLIIKNSSKNDAEGETLSSGFVVVLVLIFVHTFFFSKFLAISAFVGEL